MRKIDLSTYYVRADGTDTDIPYLVRESLVASLFSEEQKLSAVNLLKHNKVGVKILEALTDTLLLEEAEYDCLRAGVEAARGFGRYDVEMVRRVLEAPVAEVTEVLPST